MYQERESRGERFLAYDTELTVPVPVKLRGGPDEYTLQNLTGYALLDVAVIAPVEGGYRVGWLDELPAAAPEVMRDKAAKEKEKEEPKKTKENRPRTGRGSLRKRRGRRQEGERKTKTRTSPSRCRPKRMRTCEPASTRS